MCVRKAVAKPFPNNTYLSLAPLPWQMKILQFSKSDILDLDPTEFLIPERLYKTSGEASERAEHPRLDQPLDKSDGIRQRQYPWKPLLFLLWT